MNPKDFEGLYKYKLLIPAFEWASVVCTFVGPVLFPTPWLLFVAAFMVIFFMTSSFQVWRLVGFIKGICKCLDASEGRSDSEDVPATKAGGLEAFQGPREESTADADCYVRIQMPDEQFLHAFVVPNYGEPLSMLRSTLEHLARHRGAVHRYLVILAMEVKEIGHEEKARQLQNEFRHRFNELIWTVHALAPGESQGKASNVNYGVRQGMHYFAKVGLDLERIMVTVMDADAQVPQLYVKEVDRAVCRVDDPHSTIFAGPVMFERNTYDVPVFTRIHDFMWSAMAMQNLGSSVKLGFPISNYTLSASLLQRIDFWDTTADAIGEDLHMFLKAYFKTEGQARLEAIHVPINMKNLQSASYCRTLWQRAVQSERHARGVVDFAYACKQVSCLPHISWTTILLMLKVLEAQVLPTTAPFYVGLAAGVAMFARNYVEYSELASNTLQFIVGFGAVGMLVFLCVTVGNECLRHYVRPRLYKANRPPLWRGVEYLAILVGVWVYMVAPNLYAATLSVSPFGHGEYIVADKAGDDDENNTDLENQAFLGKQKETSAGFLDGTDDVEAEKLRTLLPTGPVLLEACKAELACEVLQAAPTYQVMNGGDDVALRQRVTRQLSTAMEEDVSSPMKSRSARTTMMSYLLPIQFPFVSYSSASERD
eukprot:jgi/Botrbrau1/14289/Bobra.0369s0003.1